MQLKRLSLTLAALGLASAHALAYDYAPMATAELPNSDYAPLAAADLPISTPALSASAPALAYEAKSAAAAESATVVASAAPASAETLLPAFSAADIESLFVPSNAPMQLAALSAQEMRETEGALAWFIPVIGWTAGGAALNSFAYWNATGRVSWRDIGAGATAGFWASPITRPFGNVVRFGGGTLGATAWHRR